MRTLSLARTPLPRPADALHRTVTRAAPLVPPPTASPPTASPPTASPPTASPPAVEQVTMEDYPEAGMSALKYYTIQSYTK